MPDFLRLGLALFLGAAGGGAFHALSLPLPWMLGALFATMVAAVAGAPMRAPVRIRPATVAVIGVMLGARFSPAVLSQLGDWVQTLLLLTGYIFAVGLTVVPFYRYVGRFDWTTAYFAGMPGGLTEMIEIGEAKGARVPPIILAHSLRIVVTIALIAFWFRVVQGQAVGGAPAPAVQLGWVDALLLLICAVVGSLLGQALRFPAPTFLGPLALSAVLHLTNVTAGAPPALLVNAAQVILGTVLGCRFQGIRLPELARAGFLSLGSTVLTLGLALATGLLMRQVAGVGVDQALLALAPGGLTEMGLIALAIHADVAFVALHHVVRILFVIVAAPTAFTLIGGWLAGRRRG